MLGSFYRQDINVARNQALIRSQFLRQLRPYRKRLMSEVEDWSGSVLDGAQDGHALYEEKGDIEDGKKNVVIGEMLRTNNEKAKENVVLTKDMADPTHKKASDAIEDLIAEEKDPQKRVELELKNIALNEPDVQSIQGDTPSETPRQPVSLLQKNRKGVNGTPGVNGSLLLADLLDDDDVASILGYRDPSVPRKEEKETIFSPKKKNFLSPQPTLDKPSIDANLIPVAPPAPGQRKGLPRETQPKPTSNPSPQTIDENFLFKNKFPEPAEDEKRPTYYLITPDGQIKDLSKEGYDSKTSLLGERKKHPVPKLVTKTDIGKMDWSHGSSVPAIGGGRIFISYSKPK